MHHLPRPRTGSAATALGLVITAASIAACSSAEPPKKSASDWQCTRADVPMGEVVRCTSSRGASETNEPSDPTTSPPSDQVFVRSYGVPGDDGSGSPSGDATSGTDSSGETESGGESSTPYECKTGSSDADCPSDASPPITPSDGDSTPGPDECAQVPDLPYCGGSAEAPPPADEWDCVQDANGNKTCQSAPSCGKGSHPSACGACVLDGEPDDCVPPSQGGCWVTGGGFIVEPSIVPGAPADGHDNFGGNAKQMKNGTIQGHWNHVDHGTQNHAKGRPEYIYCRHVDEPGPGQPGGKKGFTMNQIYFGGPAEWRSNGAWSDGYWFDVVAKDHGEPGSQPSPKNGFMVDSYHFTIRKMDDPAKKVSGPVVYEVKGGLVGGNIQMHPPNGGHPGFQSPLPTWVGLEP